jgi:hypothetical protein
METEDNMGNVTTGDPVSDDGDEDGSGIGELSGDGDA